MVRLYTDENVEGAIVRALSARGIEVLTAEQDGRANTPDPKALDRAGELGRVIFTRDRDFLREATRRQRNGESFGGVVYAHKIFVSLSQCIDDIELMAKAGSSEDFANTVYFLPL